MPDRPSALHGITVLDLSHTPVGAQVSQTLADFGADVLWVEPPGGSGLRQRASFPFLARGKHSMVADLRSPADRARVRGLATRADVIVQTFRPGTAERLGLGYAELAATNRGLIQAEITGFGRRGPWAGLKGYEGVVAAVTGLAASFQKMHAAQHPPFVSAPWASFAAAQSALHGILAAIHEREDSGHGQQVEVNLAHALTTLDPWNWNQYVVARKWPDAFTPVAKTDAAGRPMSHLSLTLITAQTKDGRWLQFAQNSTRLYQALMREIGLGDMLTDPQWAGIPKFDGDPERLGELWRHMLAAIRTRTLAEWLDVFDRNPDVYAEVYRLGPEALDHPQLAATGLVTTVEDPERGPVRQPGPIAQLFGTPADVSRPAPSCDDTPEPRWPEPTTPLAPAPTGRLPLEGITVLEFAVLYAAPYAATVLTDLGARVIKVEALDGDPVRLMAGFPDCGSAKSTQGKQSVAIDTSTEQGRQIVRELVARADAVLEGFRDGAAERMGIDAATLRAINPDLVYLSAHGYGVGGPCGNRPAFAPSIGAASGIGMVNLGTDAEAAQAEDIAELGAQSWLVSGAVTSRYATADGSAAIGAATALLLGLVARKRGCGGQHVASSMLHTATHSIAEHVTDFPDRPAGLDAGPDMRGPSALYRTYDASEGWVFLAAPQPSEWPDLVAALLPYVDLARDGRFATADSRAVHDAELANTLAAVFAKHPAAAWQDELTAQDVTCVKVHTGDLEDLYIGTDIGAASGYVAEVEHPVLGTHLRVAPVFGFSRSATQALPGGRCGDSTSLVLRELGYSDEQIADLVRRKVVGIA